MNGIWIAVIFVLWYTLSLVLSETFEKRCRINKQWLFFICIVFSPVVGLLVSRFTKKKEQ